MSGERSGSLDFWIKDLDATKRTVEKFIAQADASSAFSNRSLVSNEEAMLTVDNIAFYLSLGDVRATLKKLRLS